MQMQILDDFKKTHKFYEGKYKNQVVFKSMKMIRNSSGNVEPVFYVGVPGATVAMFFAFVILATIYIISLPFMWYVWLPYVLFIIFGLRISLKMDKVKQVRYMVSHLLDMSLKLLEKADAETDKEKKQIHIDKAEERLKKVIEYVDEPAVQAQLDLISKS